MKKNALLFFVFCVLLSAFVFGLDKGAKIVFQSALFHVKMPMWLGALVFGLCACVLFLIVAKMVEALKNQMHENMLKVSGTRANDRNHRRRFEGRKRALKIASKNYRQRGNERFFGAENLKR